jgi:hypothetical protein
MARARARGSPEQRRSTKVVLAGVKQHSVTTRTDPCLKWERQAFAEAVEGILHGCEDVRAGRPDPRLSFSPTCAAIMTFRVEIHPTPVMLSGMICFAGEADLWSRNTPTEFALALKSLGNCQTAMPSSLGELPEAAHVQMKWGRCFDSAQMTLVEDQR